MILPLPSFRRCRAATCDLSARPALPAGGKAVGVLLLSAFLAALSAAPLPAAAAARCAKAEDSARAANPSLTAPGIVCPLVAPGPRLPGSAPGQGDGDETATGTDRPLAGGSPGLRDVAGTGTEARDGMIQIGTSLTRQIGARRPGRVAPPAGEQFYPDVAPVSLTAAGGSLKFPEGNWNAQTAREGLKAYKGLLYQDRAGLTVVGSGTPQASFAIVRLPVDKRDGPYMRGIFGHSGTGGNRLRLALGNAGHSIAANRNAFMAFQYGAGGSSVSALSPRWDEDAALVVLHHDGVDQWAMDWYSLTDGSRHAGTPVTAVVNNPSGAMTGFNIGGIGALTTLATDTNVANDMPWDGEIAAVGYLSGAVVAPADWARIAMGAPLSAVLPVSAVKWLREFNGTVASLAKPAWATSDATGPAVAVPDASPSLGGTMLVPGSTLRRQSEGTYVTIDGMSPGLVFGLKRGAETASVPFSGRASGPVEIRVFEAETGAIVRDWTAMPAPVDGVWAGRVLLPESTNGWLQAEARLTAAPSVTAHARSEFGVGYKFMVMGQSQTAMPMINMTTRLSLEPGTAMTGSVAQLMYLGARAALGEEARRPVMGRIGTGVGFAPSDGFVTFLNQFRRLKPKTPVMIVNEAVSGTSMRALLAGEVDAATDRQWADITDKLDLWGRDYTAVLWNWLMNEGALSGSDVAPLMSAMFLPGHEGDMTHSLARELEPGWTLGVIGGDRESRITGREGMRAARAAFAQDNGFTLGPVVSDYRIENAGGPHPGKQFTNPAILGYTPPETFDHGMSRFMQRMAVMALQTIGAIPDAAVHPHYAPPRLSPDGTQIWIDVIAAGGGAIYSPAPGALRSWYVKEPGDAAFAATLAKGAAAVLNTAVSPPRVEITRASGVWAEGTVVQRMDDSEKRADNDGAAEDAIHAGGIYEDWAHDPLGFGFPVVGMRDSGGRWRNLFEHTVSPSGTIASVYAASAASTPSAAIAQRAADVPLASAVGPAGISPEIVAAEVAPTSGTGRVAGWRLGAPAAGGAGVAPASARISTPVPLAPAGAAPPPVRVAATEADEAFTVASSDGTVQISGLMPEGSRIGYTADPQRQAVIVPPPGGVVRVLSRTPATTTDAHGRTIHGATLNPGPGRQGYDQRAKYEDGRVNGPHQPEAVAGFPLEMRRGDILVAARSHVPLDLDPDAGLVDEYFSLLIADTLPGPDDFAPPVNRETVAPIVFERMDVAAIVRGLPRYPAAGTRPPRDLDAYLARAEKFQASLGSSSVAGNGRQRGGFGEYMPYGTGLDDRNYGREIAAMQAGILPILWTDAGTPEQTARAVRAVISWGIQVRDIAPGPNGGIWSFMFPMAYLQQYWAGADLSRYVIGDRGESAPAGGNILGQYYVETEESLARYRTPHESPDLPSITRIRTVTGVSGQKVTLSNSEAERPNSNLKKAGLAGLLLKSVDGTKSARIIQPRGGNVRGDITLTLQGSNQFRPGDKVFMSEDGTLRPGDPNWSIRWGSDTRTARQEDNPSPFADYRILATGLEFVMAAQALGIVHPTWDASLVEYARRTVPPLGREFGNYPSAMWPYPHISEDEATRHNNARDTWGLRLWRRHWAELEKVPQLRLSEK